MQCKEWDDANSELFKESHDEAVHKNSYKSRLYELISASLDDRLRMVGMAVFGCPLLAAGCRLSAYRCYEHHGRYALLSFRAEP